MCYFFSDQLEAFLQLALRRMSRGMGCVLLLDGPPGGGKTSFAKAMAERLAASLHFYSCNPDKERNLLYEVDVNGVLRRDNGWLAGPAWEAFEASAKGEHAVLLIDEVDKASQGFDSFLFRLLEEWSFRGPDGQPVTADPSKLVVILTTNGRRKLWPEVLRRAQRVSVPFPEGERLRAIIRQIAGLSIPTRLLELVIRLASLVRRKDADQAPSPKEMALACVDLLALGEMGTMDLAIWSEIAASYLVKNGGRRAIDKAIVHGQKGGKPWAWARALRNEARKGLAN